MDETQAIAAAASAEHVNAQAVATEAAERSRAAQIREIMAESDVRMTQMLTSALHDVFGPEDSGSFIMIKRIPLICKDITSINQKIDKIDNNIVWGVRIVIGAVILALLSLVLRN